RLPRFERFSGEIGHDAAGRGSSQRRDLLRGLQDVIVEVQGCPHLWIITHHASDVKASPCHRATGGAGFANFAASTATLGWMSVSSTFSSPSSQVTLNRNGILMPATSR